MSSLFQHHPDGRIKIVADDRVYLDTLENFRQDYTDLYPDLSAGVKAFQFVEGRAPYYITAEDKQIPSDIDPGLIQNVLSNLTSILANQQTRRNREMEEAEAAERDPDTDHWLANEAILKQVAERLGLETTGRTWREDLYVQLVQTVFPE